MEQFQINSCPELKTFLETRQKETLSLAQQITQRVTKDIVEKEMALMDFELLLSVNLSKKEETKITAESRKIREQSWKEVNDKFNGNYGEAVRFIDDF